MSNHQDHNRFCCTSGLTSPQPPARLYHGETKFDESAPGRFHLAGILAAASLPDGHPHVPLSWARKAECDETIIHSPKILDKMKMHCRRTSQGLPKSKSTSLLGRIGNYDEDARTIASVEVLRKVEAIGAQDLSIDVPPLETCRSAPKETSKEGLRARKQEQSSDSARNTSVVPIQYLPRMRKSQSHSLIGQGTLPGRTQGVALLPPSDVIRLPPVDVSTLNVVDTVLPTSGNVRRSQVTASQTGPQVLQNRQSTSGSARTILRADPTATVDKIKPPEGHTIPYPALPVQTENGTSQDRNDLKTSPGDGDEPFVGETEHKDGTNRTSGGLHLHTMDIPHKLRSMSQLSDPVNLSSEILISSHQPWSFDFHEIPSIQEQGDLGFSAVRSRAENESHRPLSRIRSPAQASSIYSRPSSMNQDPFPALNTVTSEWPLLSPTTTTDTNDIDKHDQAQQQSSLCLPPHQQSEHMDKPGLNTQQYSTTRTGSGSGKSNTSNQSKQSRFMERFSPPTKLIRKRRSMFRFLRPGSRKQQTRSISSPMLTTRTNQLDGPTDDPALLTVTYELPEPALDALQPKSSSMVKLRVPNRRETSMAGPVLSDSSPSNTLDRRPSMIDYERSLTIIGDDRRRPSSSVDARRLQEVEAEDHPPSLHLHRSLSRAKPLGDTSGQLMAQALAKHQDEKALFRSASKHRESLPPEEVAEHGSDNVGSPSLDDDVPTVESAPPKSAAFMSVFSLTGKARKTREESRIGIALASWSRYPSHSRPERCASAGKADDVKVRDFALRDEPQVESTELCSPNSKKSNKTIKARLRNGLPRSRSSTFGGFIRYYANIFSTGANQNRRSSVATGGWLEHPDLEMLSPVPHSETHHHHSLRKHLRELEDVMREDVEALEAETDKLFHPDHKHHRDDSLNAVKMPHPLEAARAKSPFRMESPFQDSYFSLPIKRRSMAYGPGDEGLDEDDTIPFKLAVEAEEGRLAKKSSSPPPGSLHLDGAHEEKTVSAPATMSKASAWADMYQQCILRPSSFRGTRDNDQKAMPPPMLKPTKSRSPQQPLRQISKTAVIRKFPSVTVIDDWKGHSRSVSLISVVDCGIGRGVDGTLRSSTNDLIELIEKREREEREKLLAGDWKK